MKHVWLKREACIAFKAELYPMGLNAVFLDPIAIEICWRCLRIRNEAKEKKST
jgi:hypothetical protein